MQEQAHKLGNYVVTSNNGKLTINPAPLTVTAADANRLYGDPNPAFTGTITGIKNADNITATYASAATVASPVGTYAIVPALVDPDHKLGNYVVTSNDGKLTVNPAPLTVTAADAGRLYGDPNPSFTGTITGSRTAITSRPHMRVRRLRRARLGPIPSFQPWSISTTSSATTSLLRMRWTNSSTLGNSALFLGRLMS